MSTVTWGWHLSVNASFCNLDKITDRDNVYNFIKQLVVDIDMEPYGEPDIVYFGVGDKSGFTSQQLISPQSTSKQIISRQLIYTSNICAHYVDEYKAIFLDVFSCKPFEIDIVVELVKQYFDAQQVTTTFNARECEI